MKNKDFIRLLMQSIFVFSILLSLFLVYRQKKIKDNPSSVSIQIKQMQGLGKRIDYYPNGQIKAKGMQNQFQKDGLWTYYDTLGNPLLYEKYKMGELIHSESSVK